MPPTPPVVLTHRWSFNEPANSTQFVDSVLGVTNGIVHGGARIDGNGNLVLAGLNQNTNYADIASLFAHEHQLFCGDI